MAADESHDDKTQSFIALTSGTVVLHYKILEKIGAGGMGEVYLAEDTKLNRKVALKFLPSHLCQDEDCRKRFTREAQAAASLDHPNIAGIYEVGEFNGRPFFSMQVVEGQSLREVITGKDLPIERILEIAIQACEGLHAAHDKGIIHRDIKPSNVLMDSHSRVRIVDFGLAAISGSEQLTKTGSTLGTVGYMSPEQIEGHEIDHRSDLFSLGVVLYELITKQNPFKRDSEAATLKAVCQDNPEPLARYKSNIPDELQRTVSKLLEKDPSMRYQVAAGVTSDLKRLIPPTQSTISTAPVKARSHWPLWAGAGILFLVLIAVLGWQSLQTDHEPVEPEGRKMLAVLPFENLGAPEDEYFADGITDEVISRLASLHGLGVISRTSSLQYKRTTKNLREISAELGVQYILEGTIRWDKSDSESRVRINPQLIQAKNDVHLWTESFDAVLDDIFAVQSDIAKKVAAALDVTLLGSERAILAQRPTENSMAYDYYLRGLQYLDISPHAVTSQEQMFLKAIDLDSSFALAYARLGLTHSTMYWYYHDHSEERLVLAKEAIDRALDLSPDLVEAHIAMGMYFYRAGLDYNRALQELDMAQQNQPNNSEIYMASGTIKRRQGNWDEAVIDLRESVMLDPQSVRAIQTLASTMASLGRYAEAEHLYNRAMTVDPEYSQTYFLKADLYLEWKGDTRAARLALQDGYVAVGDVVYLAVTEVLLDVLDGDYDRALQKQIDSNGLPYTMMGDSSDYYVFRGNIYRFMDRPELMQACYDSAVAILEPRASKQSEDVYVISLLSLAYAGLGRKDEAIRTGQRAVELCPVTKDAIDGPGNVLSLAEVYVMVGEYDLAIDQLDYLASVSPAFSTAILKIRPVFAPLHDNPRFRALLKKYGTKDGP